jgi:hypothetical protein
MLLMPIQAAGQQPNFQIKPDVRVREDPFACKEISDLDRLLQINQRGVGCERRGADCAHRDRARQRPLYCMPDNRRNYPKAERTHAHAFGEGCHGAVAQCHSHHEQADTVVRGVA